MSDVVLDSFLTTIAAAPATADDQVSENQSTAEEKTSKRKPALPASWHPFTYDELRRELGTIKDMPEKALDAITTAAFLCATMPGPVRDAWRIARKPFDRLLAALLETGYAPDWKQTLWEMRSRFERDRQFELREASRPPIAALISGDPDDDLENLEFAEPVESDSVEVGMERVRTGRKKWKHFTDFVVIVVRVLEEAGCPEASEDRRDEALKAGKAFVRSSFDIVFDVVDLAWGESSQTDDPRSLDALRKAYQRGTRELSEDVFGNPFKPGDPGISLIKLLEEHRRKRGALGLGCIFLRR